MRRRPNAFWRFSLATDRAPAVAAACLALQDRWGADVNLLLFCCWLGRGGRALDKRALRAAMLGVDTLQAKVIRPLRQSRRALRRPPRGMPKTWTKQLKDRIAAVEIDLEYVEHRILFAAARRLPAVKRKHAARAAIDASLSRYLTLLDVPLSHPDRRRALVLLEACCPVDQDSTSGSSRRQLGAGDSVSGRVRRSQAVR